MEMMMKKMMQVDKQPEFYYNDVVQIPPAEPLAGATASNTLPQLGSQTTGSVCSEPVHPTPGFLTCPGSSNDGSQKKNSMASMREVIFRIAAMQPVHIDPDSVKPPKRRNVKISKDPQSVAARLRRERISERIRMLQRLVPGGTKMDTASILDEAIHYIKFLKSQVQSLERVTANNNRPSSLIGFPVAMSNGSFLPNQLIPQNLHQYGDAN